MIGNAPFFVVGVLFLMGLVSIFLSKNLIKIAIAISTTTGTPITHGHTFGFGTTAPHFGHAFAVVLISLLHSLHAVIAMCFPLVGG